MQRILPIKFLSHRLNAQVFSYLLVSLKKLHNEYFMSADL